MYFLQCREWQDGENKGPTRFKNAQRGATGWRRVGTYQKIVGEEVRLVLWRKGKRLEWVWWWQRRWLRDGWWWRSQEEVGRWIIGHWTLNCWNDHKYVPRPVYKIEQQRLDHASGAKMQGRIYDSSQWCFVIIYGIATLRLAPLPQ